MNNSQNKKQTFEEQFPSLAHDGRLYQPYDIMNACVDKRKVRKVLRKYLVAGIADMSVMIPIIEKDLGL